MKNAQIVIWNSQSLSSKSKKAQLYNFLTTFKPDILALLEVKKGTLPSLPTHYTSYEYRHHSGHGGIILIYKLNRHINIRKDLSYNSDISHTQILTIHTTTFSNITKEHHDHYILFTYIHNLISDDEWKMLSSHAHLINTQAGEHANVMLAGDFNSRHASFGDTITDSNGKQLLDLTSSLDMSCINTIYCHGTTTHPNRLSDSVLDLAFATRPDFIYSMAVLDDSSLLSDHYPIHLSVDGIPTNRTGSKSSHLKWRLEKEIDWEGLNDDLYNALSQPSPLDMRDDSKNWSTTDIDKAVDTFNSTVHSALMQYVGLKKISRTSKPWFNFPEVKEALLNLREHKKRLHNFLRNQKRKHRRVDPNRALDADAAQLAEREKILRGNYNKAHRSWIETTNTAQSSSWKQFCESLSDPESNKLVWSTWKRNSQAQHPIIDKSNANFSEIQSLLTSGKNNMNLHISDEEFRRLSALDKFAMSITAHDPVTIDQRHDNIIREYEQISIDLKEKAAQDASNRHLSISPDEIEAAANGMKLSAAGPDHFPSAVVKRTISGTKHALSKIFSHCIRLGYIPKIWKTATAIALYKGKGEKNDPSNYRPLQITSAYMRLFERVIHPHLWSIIESQLRSDQYGFRPGISTYDNIFDLTESIKEALAQNNPLPVAFLDLRKAFDRVWHDGLLVKLQRMGVPSHLLRVIRSFLTDRSYKLVHEGLESNLISAPFGVPQGSVLAPMLFLVYINDLPTHPRCKANLFADDVAVRPRFPGRENFKYLQITLDKVSEWATLWRMSWNIDKSGILICKKKSRGRKRADQHNIDVNYPFSMNGIIVPLVQSYKHLGLHINNSLSWSSQLDYVLAKAQKTCFLICRLIQRDGPPNPYSIIHLVKAVLIPQITYAIAFWLPSSRHITSLQSLVVKPLRLVLGLPKKTSIADILYECRVPFLKTYREYAIIKYASRMHKEDTPLHLRRNWRGSIADAVLNKRVSYTSEYSTKEHRYYHINTEWFSICSSTPWQLPTDFKDVKEQHTDQVLSSKFISSLQNENRLLQSLSSPLSEDPALPQYFFTDDKPALAHRARLRFDQALTNASLFKRKLLNTDVCPLCGEEPETVQHILIFCAKYSSIRQDTIESLRGLGCRLTTEVALGKLNDFLLTPTQKASILTITSQFISAIHEIRKF